LPIRNGYQKIKNGDTIECFVVGYKIKQEVIQGNNIINFILEKEIAVDSFSSVHSTYTKHIIDEAIADRELEKERKKKEEEHKKGYETEDYNKIITFVCIPPEYPGGHDAVERYVLRNITIPDTLHSTFYPKSDGNFRGTMKIGLTINTQGNVANVKIIKGVDKLLDAEVMRVLNDMRSWKPAIQNGKNIEYYKEFVFQFDIQIRYPVH
jgi:TonB family protein